MKKILLGLIAIGFISCSDTKKNKYVEQAEKQSSTIKAWAEKKTVKEEKGNDVTDSSTGDDTIDAASNSSSVEYGEGATDIDGNTYKSVIIGTQEWISENLRTTKYSDGTVIPNVTDGTQWHKDTTGAWSHYDYDNQFDNDNQYDSIYGKLYNWFTVETGKLCPTGWHVPTDAEWTVLNDYLEANGHDGTEGKALKSTSGWDEDGNGTDNYGWNGFPGGYRNYSGYFGIIGYSGYWWSSSQSSTSNAWARILSSYGGLVGGLVYRYDINKSYGFSVRCLRD